MSDQTNPAGAGDFRGSAADKRKDETVMVNADDLSNLVSNARQEPVAPQQPAPAEHPPVVVPTVPVPAKSGPPVALIAGILGVVAVIVVIALIVMLAGR